LNFFIVNYYLHEQDVASSSHNEEALAKFEEVVVGALVLQEVKTGAKIVLKMKMIQYNKYSTDNFIIARAAF